MNFFAFVFCVWFANLLTILSVVFGVAIYEEVGSWLDYRRKTRDAAKGAKPDA